jgi:hypothetical protein
MEKTDTPRFAAGLAQLCMTFSQKPTTAQTDAYYMALEDLDIDAVLGAMQEAARQCEFFPRPVHLRRLAGEQPVAELAADAWEETLRLARDSANARHNDEIAEEVVRNLGGWRKLGMTDTERMDYIRKQFTDLYETKARRGDGPALQAGNRLLRD